MSSEKNFEMNELSLDQLDKVSGGKDDPSTTLTEFRRY